LAKWKQVSNQTDGQLKVFIIFFVTDDIITGIVTMPQNCKITRKIKIVIIIIIFLIQLDFWLKKT